MTLCCSPFPPSPRFCIICACTLTTCKLWTLAKCLVALALTVYILQMRALMLLPIPSHSLPPSLPPSPRFCIICAYIVSFLGLKMKKSPEQKIRLIICITRNSKPEKKKKKSSKNKDYYLHHHGVRLGNLPFTGKKNGGHYCCCEVDHF